MHYWVSIFILPELDTSMYTQEYFLPFKHLYLEILTNKKKANDFFLFF